MELTVDLKVQLGPLRLKNPIMTASGTFGYGEEYAHLLDLNKLGAIVTKGLSLQPRLGNPPPRLMETPSGVLNAIGLENIGVKKFIQEKLPFLKKYSVPIIVNIFGEKMEEYERLADLLSEAGGIAGLELNISCPNVKKGGISFGTDPKAAGEVTRRVKKSTDLPVIVKLSPNVTDITEIARRVEDNGADIISLINTIPGMSVNVETRRPHLKNITGGLSGPAIKPIALRMVWQVVKVVSIPVIGIGGILTVEDALEFLIVGAKAVQIGTANFVDPQSTIKIINGLEEYLRKHGLRNISNLVGTLRID